MAVSRTLYFPALQGEIGDWLYYVGLMRLADLSERVDYAREIHHNNKLSDLIQRQLEDRASGRRRDRVTDISTYLTETPDRFFNSLVVGVYGGEPQWHPFDVEPRTGEYDETAMREINREAVGFLELTGGERLFALDGQHRLAGVKEALTRRPELGSERVSVIFVTHRNDLEGVRRTRRLFISLNKKAVPVSRRDIIALDEVDIPAIITRTLVDDHKWFARGQIDIERFSQNLPASDMQSLLTLGALYDVVKITINQIVDHDPRELRLANRVRLPEDRIAYYQSLCINYFERLSHLDPSLLNYFTTDDFGPVAAAARTVDRPHVLFRPAGQLIVARVLGQLRRTHSLEESFTIAGKIPRFMTAAPFRNIVWDVDRSRIINRGQSLTVRLLLYMLGAESATGLLRQSYANFLGRPVEEVQLPERLF